MLDIKKKAETNFSPNNAPYKVATVNYPPDSITLPKKLLSTIKFLSNIIFDIIQLLDLNKAHSHDMIIIRILKICGKSICRLFELIFNECISKKKLFNDRNKSRVNDKKSFISNPYLFMATRFV